MGKMVDRLNSQAEMLREERNLNSLLRNTIKILKDDIFSKKTKIEELEKILANKDKTIPAFSDCDNYSDKKCTNKILPHVSAQRTYTCQHASKSLETPQQPQ